MSRSRSQQCCSASGLLIVASGVRAYLAAVARAVARARFFPADVAAIRRNDPALRGRLRVLEVPLYASFWALLLHRVAHALHATGLPVIPRLLSQVARWMTGIEIHPASVIGPGLFIDHGMGVVIGETAIVGASVVLFHGVTLGGVDGRPGRRHPLVEDEVLIGAGAKILGPVRIGRGARVGAQAVVLADVTPGTTVVGIPAREVARRARSAPAAVLEASASSALMTVGDGRAPPGRRSFAQCC